MTSSDTARLHADTLADHLKTHLPHRRIDALKRLAEVHLAVLQAESTLHRKIALQLPWDASLESILARSPASSTTLSSPRRTSQTSCCR